jgi:NADH:ubiquinone oxidoreductase subunit D
MIVSEEFQGTATEVLKKMNSMDPPHSWHTSAIETPNGEGGFSVVAGKGWKLNRVRIKTPSYSLSQALPSLTLGLRENELRASIASLGLRRSEIDR